MLEQVGNEVATVLGDRVEHLGNFRVVFGSVDASRQETSMECLQPLSQSFQVSGEVLANIAARCKRGSAGVVCDRLEEDVVGVGPAPIDRRTRDAGQRGESCWRDGLLAFFDEELPRSVEDSLSR